MSRSNYDKPFYVDVGTSIVAIRCASNHDVVVEYDHELHPCAIKTLEDACDRMNEEAEIGKHPPIDNAAAMREALVKADAVFRLISKSAWFIDANFSETKEVMEAGNAIAAALSAPPRNCDVGTAEEQAGRFHSFCKTRQSGIYGMCSPQCPCKECSDMCHCLTKWSQMAYEEGGAK